MTLEFVKYHGLGNDFILIDDRDRPEPRLSAETAVHLCDRHRGIGADGVIFVLPGVGNTDYAMRMYNSDGSIAEMCGNGIRCFAQFVAELEGTTGQDKTYSVDTLAGVMGPRLHADGQVSVDMGPPGLLAEQVPTTLVEAGQKAIDVPLAAAGHTWRVTAVSMGNPHCITFVDDVVAVDVTGLGPHLETHPAFPKKTNVEFVQVVRRDYLKMRVWERGAGLTLACGTGACATLVAAVLAGLADRAATVELPGGPLEIVWEAESDRLWMTGPATRVFAGTLALGDR